MYDSTYLTFTKFQNYSDGKHISGCQRFGKFEGKVGGFDYKELAQGRSL